ncbi:Phage integrase family protein [Novosphingobium sp. CF614]|uniref:tyrosine-type recombinase/integrase n=1 Tax=Novosphingobium sp. CF614 TaxID=1884364 RepID=UPI0008E7D850|nr:tyrosine-type recombinase/integrase [Novosphingobium sp. CF614]SFG09367.1 Phage integrase family protein [Novosphingobium sp. CF614]
MSGLHVVSKLRKGGRRWYVYAWRGGPCIHQQDGARPVITPEILALQQQALQSSFGPAGDDVDALIADYEASPDFTGRRESTRKGYRLWLTRISQRFGSTPIAAFEDRRMRGDIIAWRNQWAHQPRTADTAAGMIAILLNWAVENGRVEINVAAGIRQLHAVNLADLVWEDRHWQAVRAIEQFPGHIMDALTLASLTGLRMGDLVRLDWSQVGEKAIIVEKTRKRGGRAVIPIYPELRQWLDARSITTGTVLLNSRKRAWTENGLKTVWQRHKPKGFDRRIHDLRGTFVTMLAVKGLTDEEIARIVGWTAKRIGQIRARYVDEARVIVTLADRLSA